MGIMVIKKEKKMFKDEATKQGSLKMPLPQVKEYGTGVKAKPMVKAKKK